MPTLLLLLVTIAAWSAACARGTMFTREYEYEEELTLALDGSATLNVNASVASLVALRGADLRTDPASRLDRERVRAFFEGPGVEVKRVSLSRRHGRRFVHVGIDVADVRKLSRVPAFAWSTYRLGRKGEVVEYAQIVGAASRHDEPADAYGWTGNERVAFRMHLPSRIPFHNSPETVQRGNILVWEQPLRARLAGEPVDIQVQMEPASILYSTLLLFGGTIVAAALTFAVVIWWIVRRGRGDDSEVAGS